MRQPRPAARILLVDAQQRTLLFRFTPDDRPPLWCTPGGAVDPGESYAAAARRELWEEVGLDMDCGPEVAQRTADFRSFEGVEVTADERYFRVDIAACDVSDANLTAQERRLMAGWRWFTRAEITGHDEIIYPRDLVDILDATEPALRSIALSTGVTLDVATAGDPAAPAIVLLHGFPESHRAWRDVIPGLAKDHFVIAPDQRGFARSSKPADVADYTPDKMVGDVIALADHYGIDRFTLLGHDWGGAIAWMAALSRPDRVARLVILNAPHPFVFQKTLFDDLAQREASQYITAFRSPTFESHIDGIGLETFFDTSFARHSDSPKVAEEKPVYLDQWGQPGAMTAMLNWYRASQVIVPAMDATLERPAFLDAPFPPVTQPTLVIWGMHDKALLPSQLDGLDALVPDLTVIHVDAGHFVPWEAPEAVTHTILKWLG